MPARVGGGILPTKSLKMVLGTSYGRPVAGTDPSAFGNEGPKTFRPKHLEKVREEEEKKEAEEDINEMLFHHKPRPAAEGPAPASPNVLIDFFLVMLVKGHGCTPA